ncbi:MAG TPA: hypothetical protein VNA16_01985, partial [Abditibacteriaceae bacterium]|nr:hypothetical protein [Abditibacteriaceae bacterium]
MLQMYIAGWLALGIACVNAAAKPVTPGKATKPAPAQPAKAAQKPVTPFIAVQPDAGAALPPIVVQHDAKAGTGFDWEKLSKLPYYQALSDPGHPVLSAVRYLREAVQRMTGKELPVVASNDLARGIVLTTLAGAPPELKKDPEVMQALRNTGADAYNANEAYYVRSEPKRIVIVANTTYGLSHGVIELLESAGYEALGMGPNWTHVPDYKS